MRREITGHDIFDDGINRQRGVRQTASGLEWNWSVERYAETSVLLTENIEQFRAVLGRQDKEIRRAFLSENIIAFEECF